MAIDVSKARRRLPPPPPLEEGAAGIEQTPPSPAPAPVAVAEPILDGRSMRATGRTMQLNIKITPEVKTTILRLAKERGQLVTEVIEDAIEALTKTDR
jgi:hypothetical protein